MTDTALNRETMVQGSASFRAATRLFERELREDVWALYAWCRYCDDRIDGQALGHGFEALTPALRTGRLEELRRETGDALSGRSVASPPFQALQSVAVRRRLSPEGPVTLLDGFAMDVDERRYEALDDLLVYCWGVAGVVGVMMAEIMEAREPEALRRAQDLGLAFQLTNIVRDIMEDARAGRVYLPAAALRARGVQPEPDRILEASRDSVFEVAEELLTMAEAYYKSARVGIRALPFRAALATAAARGVYREIGRRIRRRGPAGLDSRMVVPRPVKLWLAARGAGIALWSRLEWFFPWPDRPDLWTRL